MSQNTTFRSQKQRFEARDPYKESYKAAKKAQEEKPKEEQPAPLNDGFLSQEQKKLLDELLQNQKERDEREKMAKESHESQPFEELSSQLQRPGNQARIKAADTVPTAWFVLPKGAPDEDENLKVLIRRDNGKLYSENEVEDMAFQLKNCEKELTDRVFLCEYTRTTAYGEDDYEVTKRHKSFTEYLLKHYGGIPPRILADGVYSGAIINLGASTRRLPMVLSSSTLALGDDVLLEIEPSYSKGKITFTARNGMAVEEVPTVTLSDLPSSVNRKK